MSRNEKPPKPAAAAPADGERIAKYLARAGVCSRRDAEKLIEAGKVTVDGTVLDSPAVKVTGAERITVEGRVIGTPQRPRMWRFHKQRGLVVSHKDEQGRPTVFDYLRDGGLPRVISIGRLDLNSEGLLLLTNDGELARKLELPSNAWVRRYKVRVAGGIDPNRLEALKKGITVEGVRYGPIEVEIDRVGGLNGWLYVSLTEGKNREIRKVLEHLGLSVNRLVRVSYGPFDLDKLDVGNVMPIGQVHVDALLRGDEVFLDKPEPRAPRKPAAPRAIDKPTAEAPAKPVRGRRREEEAPVAFSKTARGKAGALEKPPARGGKPPRRDEAPVAFSKAGRGKTAEVAKPVGRRAAEPRGKAAPPLPPPPPPPPPVGRSEGRVSSRPAKPPAAPVPAAAPKSPTAPKGRGNANRRRP